MDDKEAEGVLRSLRFELDLIEERQNQWIQRVKEIEDKLKIKSYSPPKYMEDEILEEEDGPQPL